MVEWLRKAPASVVITVIATCGVIAVGVLAAYVVLSLQGADTREFREWIMTVGQVLVYPLLGVTTVASVVSARSSTAAAEQTNGHLMERDQEIIALRRQLAERSRT